MPQYSYLAPMTEEDLTHYLPPPFLYHCKLSMISYHTNHPQYLRPLQDPPLLLYNLKYSIIKYISLIPKAPSNQNSPMLKVHSKVPSNLE